MVSIPVIVILQGREETCRSFLRYFPIQAPVIFDSDNVRRVFGVHHTPYGLIYGTGGTLCQKGSADTPQKLATLLSSVAVPHAQKEATSVPPIARQSDERKSQLRGG